MSDATHGTDSDAGILAEIHRLVEDEHTLREQVRRDELSSSEEHARLRDLEAALDQAWDLLRQRRAKREFGEDEHDARARPVAEVEDYEQ